MLIKTKALIKTADKSWWLEGGLLVVAAPFLVFPTQFYLLTLLALLVIVFLWTWPLWQKRHPFLPNTPYNLPLLLWVATLGVGIGVTADPLLTLPKATNLILSLTLWAFLVRLLMYKPKLLPWTLWGFGLGSTGFVLIGLLGANWSQLKVPFLTTLLSYIPSRLIILPENAPVGIHLNQVAGIMLLIWPVVLSLWLNALFQRSRSQWRWLGLAMFGALILLLTQSRFGWLGSGGAVVTLLLLWALILTPSPQKRWTQITFLSTLGISFTVIMAIGPRRLWGWWQNPTGDTLFGTLNSLTFRREVWHWAIQAITDFPLTGIGLGSFRLAVERLYPIRIPRVNDIAHAHNMFLQMALDVGLLGLIAYLSLLGLACYSGWYVAKRNEALRPLLLGLIAGLISLHCFYGLGDALAPGSKPNVLIWYALALLATPKQIQLNNAQ